MAGREGGRALTGPAGQPAGTAAGTPAAGAKAAGASAPAGPASTPAATAAPPADGSTSTSTSTSRRRRPSLRLSRTRLLGVALAVALVALAVTGALLLRTPSDDSLRDSALLAARTYSSSLTTFDARTLDDDVERVKRASTEQFAQEYDQTIDDLRESVLAEQTVSVGTVVGAGIEELDDRTATVLVAVNQQISGTEGEPRTEANRLRMVLERRDGRWLIRTVERL